MQPSGMMALGAEALAQAANWTWTPSPCLPSTITQDRRQRALQT